MEREDKIEALLDYMALWDKIVLLEWAQAAYYAELVLYDEVEFEEEWKHFLLRRTADEHS